MPSSARVEAQGTGDLTLSLCGAIAAFGSGFVKQGASYGVLANMGTAIAGGLLVFAVLGVGRIQRAALQPAV